MTKEINMRQFKPFDFLISEFEFNLTNATYSDGYAGIESVLYENSKRDIRVNVYNDHRGEIDAIVEKIGSGQKFTMDQIMSLRKIRQLYLGKNQEVNAKGTTNSFPLRYSFGIQIPKKMCKLASSLKNYAAPLLKGDNLFLNQLSEYCAVVNALYGQSCMQGRRNNAVTKLIENAIRNSDLTKARQLLLGLSSPLFHYEEKALEYIEKVLKGEN